MDTDPTLQLTTTSAESPLDKNLCLICQSSSNISTVNNPEHVEHVIDLCKKHKSLQTNKYVKLCNKLNASSSSDIKGISYHSNCYRKFTRDECYITRKEKDAISSTPKTPSPHTRLSRSSLQAFDVNKCVFCQDEAGEEIHECMTKARDVELKGAFNDSPIVLSATRIRVERAHDVRAGDIKYHQKCWNSYIVRRTPEFASLSVIENTESISNCDSQKKDKIRSSPLKNSHSFYRIRAIVMVDLVEGIQNALLSGNVYTVRQAVEVYEKRLEEFGLSDDRVYNNKRIWMMKELEKQLPYVRFIANEEKPNQSKRILSDADSMQSHLLKLAEERAQQDDDTEFAVLKSAASILRKVSLDFRKTHSVRFEGTTNSDTATFPLELGVFLKWLLSGERELNENISNQINCLTNTISQTILYNMKSEDQVKLAENNKSRVTRRTYQPCHQIAMALAIRKSDRNNQVLKLLSAPGYGITVSPLQALLWETRIANAVIKRISEHDGIYVPFNLEKDALPMYHLDNIDWLEDSLDGKNTTHMLQLSVFQPRTRNPPNPIYLDLCSDSKNLTLDNNNFNQLLECNNPLQLRVQKTEGCTCFRRCDIKRVKSTTMDTWMFMKIFETMFSKKMTDFLIDVAVPVIEKIPVCEILSNISVDSKGADWWEVDKHLQKELITDLNALIPMCVDISTVISNSSDTVSLDTEITSINECEIEEFNTYNHEKDEDDIMASLRRVVKSAFDDLKLPPKTATDSLVQTDINVNITNVYKTPLIPGPASSYKAIYTALMRARGITAWSCGEGSKTIISLDLDLYEKCYRLVNSSPHMRSQFILRLGELHAVFAHVRAIGNFIASSGLEEAWVEAEWFDSDCVVQQVIDCKHMKRAVEAMEASMIATKIIQWKEMIRCNPDYYIRTFEGIFNTITNLRNAMDFDYNEFKPSFHKLNDILRDEKFMEKWTAFEATKVNNFQFRFLSIFCNMIQRLITFIEATRTRNWLHHLSAAECLMQDFISMDRCNYRKGWMAYIADMKHLEISDPEIWDYFMDGNFSVQKSPLLAVAIGCDHAGEQVNCEDKSRGGLKGITRNENSRIRNYLAAPVLTQINQELVEKGGQINQTTMTHHQLRNPYVNRQNSRIISLVSVLEKHDLGLEKSENSLKNLVTNQVMTEEATLEIVNCEATGSKIYDEMIKERLQEDSNVPVFSSIKKVMIKTFKRSKSKKRIQLQDRVIQLSDDANLWRKIALISSSRELDYDNIIGHYELTITPRNLMTRDRVVYNGGHNKSSLMTEIKKAVGTNVTVHNPDIDCVAIDGMCMLNVIEKPSSIKTGADLALAVCKWIDYKTEGCSSIIVVFDTYLEASLKKATRYDRERKNNTKSPTFYDINVTSNIARLSMSNILAHEKTKHALVELLLITLQRHLKSRGIRYIVAGNHKTFCSDDDIEMANNHEEGDTLLVYCLYIATVLQDKNISVYATDTDIFALLVHHRQSIRCNHIYFGTSKTNTVSIDVVCDYLGEDASRALIGMHCITGCDTCGRFYNVSKELWVKLFICQKENTYLMRALVSIQETICDKDVSEIEKFICSGFLKGKKKEEYTLPETRVYMYKKEKADSEKIPPTRGAFRKHILRAHYQMRQWATAFRSIIDIQDPLSHGWLFDGERYIAETTDILIAPQSIIELISCNCKGTCLSRRCGCFKGKLECSEFCGCSVVCENSDPVPPDVMVHDDIEGE